MLPVKIVFNDSKIERIMREWLIANSEHALVDYRAQPLKKDDPNYPFADHPGDGDIRDPSASKVTPIHNGVRITVTARGAGFIETGNDPGGGFIDGNPLKIPLKPGRTLGRLQIINGKAFFITERVHAYEGRHLLRDAVRRAFKIPI